ncbi:MAG: glycosyltransferase family 2 protein [Gammaproteobacteria bacterium]
MSYPLVTVVIPTFRRPEFLPRAVRSALEHLGEGVEVIVVPNGGDDSWLQSMTLFKADPRVRIEPIEPGNVNMARNHGLRLARGKYLRFLDDDDYLLPAAGKQVNMLESEQAEVCSGRLASMDQDGVDHGLLGFPDTDDFVCAAVSHTGFRLLTANVFLRSLLENLEWDVDVDRAEDYVWMINLAACREWRWTHLDAPVGVWFQHNRHRRGLRAALLAPMNRREETVIARLLTLHDRLLESGRDTPQRDAAIASALWHYAHRGFPYRPFRWYAIARRAVDMSPGSRPDSHAYQRGVLRKVPPVMAECALWPARRLTRLYRDIRRTLTDREYVRKL